MYKLFSADDHIIEHARVWQDRVPAKYRDDAPRVIEEDGREYWVYEDVRGETMGLNAVVGRPRDQLNPDPIRFSEMRPGCYDPVERAKDMLADGILASVLFPTLPRFAGTLFLTFKDKALADVCVKAYNDFVIDEWCPAGPPGLFVPTIICQLWDPELGRGRDPPLRRQGRPGAVVPRERRAARAAVVLGPSLGPGLAGRRGARRRALPAHRHQRPDPRPVARGARRADATRCSRSARCSRR